MNACVSIPHQMRIRFFRNSILRALSVRPTPVTFQQSDVKPYPTSQKQVIDSVVGTQIQSIEQALEEKIDREREVVSRMRRDHGHKVIGHCTVSQAYGGLRGVICSTYETSDVDPYNGVRIRDIPIVDMHRILPAPAGCDHPSVEALLWLLLTGDVPSQEQVAAFRNQLADHRYVPSSVFRVLDAVPTHIHPMVQLSIGILALQSQSAMSEAYAKGVPKDSLWRHCLQDVLTLIAQQPIIAAYIYHRTFKLERTSNTTGLSVTDLLDDYDKVDLAARFSRMMGFNDRTTEDLFRLHLTTHMDHGGGSASCFGVRVTGSTLADAFQAWSTGVNGLAGPLHGRANEEVLRWLHDLRSYLHANGSCDILWTDRGKARQLISQFCWNTLNARRVIPGYGHTTMMVTDPRFHMQRAFASKHMPDDESCKLASAVYDVAPNVLTQHGKVRNPWPNVDAHSGVLLQNRGLCEVSFHAVMFAVSRVLGPSSNLVWDRALNLSVVRPMTVTTNWIRAKVERDQSYIPPDRSLWE